MVAYFVTCAFNPQAVSCVSDKEDVIEHHFDVHFLVSNEGVTFHFWVAFGGIVNGRSFIYLRIFFGQHTIVYI